MKVCIAEKPSVAQEIARVIGATRRCEGYFEGNGYQVTWTFGHLCCLKSPEEYDDNWKRWSLSTLPMIPDCFGIRLIDGASIRKQFNTIKKLFSLADCIINCGDAGQEGELIQRWVMQLAKAKCLAVVDLIPYGRVHPQWIFPSERPEAVRQPLSRRILPCLWRLAPGHERHKALHPALWRHRHGALHRTGADAHIGIDCQPTEGNRPFQAGTLLGTVHHLQECHLPCCRRPLLRQGQGEASPCRHRWQAAGHRQHHPEARQRGTAPALRPHFPASRLQQALRLFSRNHAQHHTVALREEADHLSACRYTLSQRRHLSEMPGHPQ